MINGKIITVCLPAYNAARTLQRTFDEIPRQVVDHVVLVDDASTDNTAALAKSLGIRYVIIHNRNLGYGANQKSCYRTALDLGSDVIVMLHPDYQYNPALIPSMSSMVAEGLFDVVIGSRILGGGAVRHGMPVYKYVSNRALTLIQNLLLDQKLSEYHTGYRVFSRQVLLSINLSANSDDFVFDNQFLAQVFYKGFRVGEVSSPAHYFPEASSINFYRSISYGLGVLKTSLLYRLNKAGIMKSEIFR